MSQPDKIPDTTKRLPELSERRADRPSKTKPKPLIQRGAPLTRLEYYAFLTVFSVMVISGFIIPQRILDEYEITILLIVGAVLGWGVRIFYKLTHTTSASDFFG